MSGTKFLLIQLAKAKRNKEEVIEEALLEEDSSSTSVDTRSGTDTKSVEVPETRAGALKQLVSMTLKAILFMPVAMNSSVPPNYKSRLLRKILGG
jgi:hypothetical protein